MHNGHKYYKFRKASIFETWQCARQACTETVKIQADDVVQEHVVHNHEGCDSEMVNRQRVGAACKRKAVEEICERPSIIIRQIGFVSLMHVKNVVWRVNLHITTIKAVFLKWSIDSAEVQHVSGKL